LNKPLTQLVDLLALEAIEQNLFRGQSQDLGLPQLFGGQVLGQALSAACRTIRDDRLPHSLHAYFLRPGNASQPVVYQVEVLRDGRSFSTRRVTAIQNGQPILSCISSFQPPEIGLEHQAIMPAVPFPQELIKRERAILRLAGNTSHITGEKNTTEIPIEVLQVPDSKRSTPQLHGAVNYTWFRAAGNLPTEQAVHRYILAYASDLDLLTTAMIPHNVNITDEFLQFASLDHAIWFYTDVKADDWLLHATESPRAANARGLSRGNIFSMDGKLVASTAQEGLIRIRGDRRNS
jgi:acyl-CoA thioesterase-2